MPPPSKSWQAELEIRATGFAKKWEHFTREQSHARSFVIEFLELFGIKDVGTLNGAFEHRVKKKDGTAGLIDYFWENNVAIEMKSTGKNLEDAFRQLTDYMDALRVSDIPDLWIVCDFQHFIVYRKDTNQSLHFELRKLRKYVKYLIGLAVDKTLPEWDLAHRWPLPAYEMEYASPEKPDVDFHATAKMVKLYDALKSKNYRTEHLEIFLTRLLFCFFADDTGIFPQDAFYHYINDNSRNHHDLSSRLAALFEDLNLPLEDRVIRTFTTNKVQQSDFQYINGSLFGERLPIAHFDQKMHDTLLECANFDWSRINPSIFGTLFQGIKEKTERREKGAHYTSEENILKLIDPLFMDGLRKDFLKAKKAGHRALAAFHDRIAKLKFLDPACGCGNFLIIAYKELRKLEHETLRAQWRITNGNGDRLLNLESHFKVTVEQFYGIEIDSWPCQIARTGMWLMDHLMNMEASEEFGRYFARIPLTKGAEIVNANALRTEWESVVPKNELSFILGNPPFVGYSNQKLEQKNDILSVCLDINGSPIKNAGKVDYVSAWFYKASKIMANNPKIRTAFVATNSITQGEQVATLWKPLFDMFGICIHFAWRTFKWSNEANGKAAVHCVILGFGIGHDGKKTIYSDMDRIEAKNINPYLVDANNVFVKSRLEALCLIPSMVWGNKPVDGGHLIIESSEYRDFVAKEPKSKKYIRRFVGSEEYINKQLRYCLWLIDADPADLRKMPLVMERIEAVKKMRLASQKSSTRDSASRPSLFQEIRQPQTDYILIPSVSSEKRHYIPIGINNKNIIVSNAVHIIPNASLYHFGILTSGVHMAWVRAVCGRLKSDFRYSKDIVYNNFPWPDATDKQKAKIEELAQGVLDARKMYPKNSLADLYDPLTMPKELLKAHQALDRAVMKLYGFDKDVTEPEIVAELMERYRLLTQGQ